jgi:YD repeat-containing protein
VRRITTFVAFVFFLIVTSAPMPRARQRPDVERLKQQLVGTYRLVSYVSYDQNGSQTRLPYGVGQIAYDGAGRMSAQLMRDERSKLTGPQASEAERAAAYSSYIAYFGHYTIDPDKRSVTHHVEGALSPNMVGSDLVRYFEFSPDGKSLFLSVKSGERVSGRLQWDRY